MEEISKKNRLAKHMRGMEKKFPNAYDFVPQSWILPLENDELLQYSKKRENQSKYFIIKPSNQSCGKGIVVTKDIASFLKSHKAQFLQHRTYVAQVYISNPFLLDNRKCDLRVYALVTTCDPLRLYVYKEGIVRLAADSYAPPNEENETNKHMHLTNHSINKKRTGTINKYSLSFIFDRLKGLKGPECEQRLRSQINDIVLKTVIPVQPYILSQYRKLRPRKQVYNESVSFALLGFNIMLDEDLKPWLIEVNESPSLATGSMLDEHIKSKLIEDTFELLNISKIDRELSHEMESYDSRRRLSLPCTCTKTTSIADSMNETSSGQYEDLNNLLYQTRREMARDDFDDNVKGSFERLFPVQLKADRKYYGEMLLEAFRMQLGNQFNSQKQDLVRTYLEIPDESQVLELLDNLPKSNICNFVGKARRFEMMYRGLEKYAGHVLPINLSPFWP